MLPLTVGGQNTAPQDYWLVAAYMQGLEFSLFIRLSSSIKPVGLCSDQGIS